MQNTWKRRWTSMELIILIVIAVLIWKNVKKKKAKKLELEQLKQNEEAMDDKTVFMDIYGNEEAGNTSFLWDDQPVEKKVILHDTENNKTFTVKVEESVIIGSSNDLCDVQIDYDRTISKRHCMLIKHGKEYFIKDLKSTNGTFLNGSRVYLDERAIHHEDWIRIGKVEMQFLLK